MPRGIAINQAEKSRKISLGLKGKKKNYSVWVKGKNKKDYPQLSNSGRKKGSKSWNTGLTKETDPRIEEASKKLSVTLLQQFASGERVQKSWNKGLTKEDHPGIASRAEKLKGRPSATKRKTKADYPRLANTGRKKSNAPPKEHKERKPNTTAAHLRLTELAKDPEWVKMKSNISKQLWQTQEYREKILSRVAKALHKRPNRPETLLQSLLEELYPNEFEYNGDGKVIILGMVPDFININGRKEIIEVFGDYWHSSKVTQHQSWNRTELGRIMAYNSLGYNCLIIWESELSEIEDTKLKIENFFEVTRNK